MWNQLQFILIFNVLGQCEMSIYPGLRRKPLQELHELQQQQQQALSSSSYEINKNFLAQLMEGNARRRLQQQFEHQLELINMQIQRQRERHERLRERYRQQQQQKLAVENRQRIQEEIAKIAYIRNYNNKDDDNNNTNRNNSDRKIGQSGQEEVNDSDFAASNTDFDFELMDRTNSDYSYKIPRPYKIHLNDHIEFAVGPSDPRFYVTTTNAESPDLENDHNDFVTNSHYRYDNNVDSDDVNHSYDSENRARYVDDDNSNIDAVALDDYEEYKPQNSNNTENYNYNDNDNDNNANDNNDNDNANVNNNDNDINISKVLSIGRPLLTNELGAPINYHRIKPHQKFSSNGLPTSLSSVAVTHTNPDLLTAHHQQLNTLVEKLTKNNNYDSHINLIGKEPTTIHLKHNMSMYMIALITGVTAALIMGLFVLTIVWYTFNRRSKAASDIDYPAYGITGPNRDLSPSLSGDRKLAQNAQMYHYQHQKQQIMAMENHCSNAEETADLAYAESDDDNEEGDYTVYECPGLAPTGEMEVKNPLFLDDTPVTTLGSESITQTIAQQPTIKKSNANSSNSTKTVTINKKCNNSNINEHSNNNENINNNENNNNSNNNNKPQCHQNFTLKQCDK